MLFHPAQLGLAHLDKATLEADKKACKKIGPCGVGKKALYLNSFYIDRRYYLPYGSISRVFKRVAMSQGGFSGKGMFASMAYLVVEYDGGKQKQCNFKDERDVDALLEVLAKEQPNIPRLSAAGEAEIARQKAEKAAQQNTLADTPSETKITTDYHLSLRANLLRWATLTPDLGVEWRICPSWGIAVNGSWTSWTWSDKDHRYALWEVAPEVRYYMGEKKAWYLGAMFKAGQFNYKLSETGKQGDLMGGGITAGYQLRLNKALALDFNLGLGYLNADFEKYEVIDGVRVRRGNETKDWCGPINAGVTLVWKLF